MIYTLTLNPSLDYIVTLNQIRLGELNRSKAEVIFPGGKGINVSQVLKIFNMDSKAIGFIAGFTGNYLEELLHSLYIETDFIKVNGETRINIKLKAEKETEINANGPTITKQNYIKLIETISNLTSDDILVLAGSIPSTMPTNTYTDLINICKQNGTKFVVDAEGKLLEKVIPHHPFLIKPNHHELGGLFNTTIHSCEEAIPYGKELLTKGAQNIIVSLAGKGAVFMNKDVTYIAHVPNGEVKGSVGAGDSMVAAFIAVYLQTHSVEEAFRYSVAAGSATAFSVGLCTREKVESILSQVKLRNI